MLSKLVQYAKKPMTYILLLNALLWIPTLFSNGIDISRWITVAIIFAVSTALTYAAYRVGRKALKFAESLLKRITQSKRD